MSLPTLADRRKLMAKLEKLLRRIGMDPDSLPIEALTLEFFSDNGPWDKKFVEEKLAIGDFIVNHMELALSDPIVLDSGSTAAAVALALVGRGKQFAQLATNSSSSALFLSAAKQHFKWESTQVHTPGGRVAEFHGIFDEFNVGGFEDYLAHQFRISELHNKPITAILGVTHFNALSGPGASSAWNGDWKNWAVRNATRLIICLDSSKVRAHGVSGLFDRVLEINDARWQDIVFARTRVERVDIVIAGANPGCNSKEFSNQCEALHLWEDATGKILLYFGAHESGLWRFQYGPGHVNHVKLLDW